MTKDQNPILIFDNTKIKTNTSICYHLFDNYYSKYPFSEIGKVKILFYGILYNKNELKLKYNLKSSVESEIIGNLFNKFGY